MYRAAQVWRWSREHSGRTALHPEHESEISEIEYQLARAEGAEPPNADGRYDYVANT